MLALIAVNGVVLLWSSGTIEQLSERIDNTLHPPPTSGFLRQTYIAPDGTTSPYHVFVPHHRPPETPLPLIVYLNGLGENGKDGISMLRNGLAEAIWEDESDFPFLVVWAQCEVNDQWIPGSRSTQRALAITQEVLRNYHGIPDQVLITGISAGGTGAWELAASYPETFSAVAPISGIPNIERLDDISQAKMPVWMFYVSDDLPIIGETCQRVQSDLLQRGLNPRLTGIPAHGNTNLDEHDAWSFAFRHAGFYRWFQEQSRIGRKSQAPAWTSPPPETLVERSSNPVQDTISDAGIVHVEPTREAPAVIATSLPRTGEIELEFKPGTTSTSFQFGLIPVLPNEAPNSAIQLHLTIDHLIDGQLRRGGLPPVSLDPAGCQSLQPNDWNHLRFSIQNHDLAVELNGWPLASTRQPRPPQGEWQLVITTAGPSPAHMDLRHPRWRETPLPVVGPTETPTTGDPSFLAAASPPRPVEDLRSQMVTAWQEREKQLSDMTMTWCVHPHFHGYECRSFRRDPQIKRPIIAYEHHIQFTPTSWHYTGPWPHRRIGLSRQAGLLGDFSLQDFATAHRSGFDHARYSPRGLTWTVDVDQDNRRDELITADGDGLRGVLFDGPDPTTDRLGLAEDLRWRGAVLACRPWTAAGHNTDPKEWSITASETFRGGVRCHRVETSIASTPPLRIVNDVDQARGFLILRSTLVSDEQLIEQVDIDYQQDDTGRWLPRSWTCIARHFGKESITAPPYPGKEWYFHIEKCELVRCEVQSNPSPVSPP